MKYLFFSIGLFITVSSLHTQRNIQDSVFLPDKPDNFETEFSLNFLKGLGAINKADSSKSYTGIYSIRFRPASDSSAAIYQGSKKMPLQLFTALKKAIEAASKKYELDVLLAKEEYYLLSVLIESPILPTERETRNLLNHFNTFADFEELSGRALVSYKLAGSLCGDLDSAWTTLSNDLRLAINKTLNEKIIDSNNIVDIFMFKFKINNEEKLCSLEANVKTSPALLTAMRLCIDSSLKQASEKKYMPSILNKTFMLPLVIDYRVSPVKRTLNNLTLQRIMELMIFDKSDNGNNRVLLIDGILLPIFFYQSPHSRSLPKSWLKEKQN